jgi:hypothetical protein
MILIDWPLASRTAFPRRAGFCSVPLRAPSPTSLGDRAAAARPVRSLFASADHVDQARASACDRAGALCAPYVARAHVFPANRPFGARHHAVLQLRVDSPDTRAERRTGTFRRHAFVRVPGSNRGRLFRTSTDLGPAAQAWPTSVDSNERSMPSLAIACCHLLSLSTPNTRSRSGGTSSQPFAWISASSCPGAQPA